MRIRSRLLSKLVVRFAVGLIRLLFRTCRVEIRADAPEAVPYYSAGARRYLYCVWHDQIIMTVFSGRPQKLAGLTSQHRDGSYVADTLEMVGIKAVRGSTNHGGAQAMRKLIEATRDWHIGITPDGPRGPRREIKTGLVFLASHSGHAIIPTAFTCRRCWKIRGRWTDMMIPKPFTRIVVRGGTPIEVPRKLRRDGLRRYTAMLQAEMERLEIEADRILRGEDEPAAELTSAA